MQSKSFPNTLAALIVGIALFNTFAHYFSWYYHFLWLDKPMHFLGGVWVSGVGLWFWYGRRGHQKSTGARFFQEVLTIALVATLAVGILWEVYEYVVHLIVGSIWSPADTVGDVVFDILGAVSAGVGFFLRNRPHPSSS
ncbi:MAG: hypothetical protein ACYC8S_01810 [Minisyncoccota bacterium]